MAKQQTIKRGDYVTVALEGGRVGHGRVQIAKVAFRVLVSRDTMQLSDEGRAKPPHERSFTDLMTTTRFWLVPRSAVTVVDRASLDRDAQMTTMIPADYGRRVGQRMADGKELKDW